LIEYSQAVKKEKIRTIFISGGIGAVIGFILTIILECIFTGSFGFGVSP